MKKDSKLIKEGKSDDHIHKDKAISSPYLSTGVNLLGQTVSQIMEKVKCSECYSESIRIIKEGGEL